MDSKPNQNIMVWADRAGTRYLRRQWVFYLWSAAFPTYAVVMQLVGFVLMGFSPSSSPLLELAIPAIFSFVMGVIALIHFTYLARWRLGAPHSGLRGSSFPRDFIETQGRPKLPSKQPRKVLAIELYAAAEHARRSGIAFLVLNLAFIAYLPVYVRFFSNLLGVTPAPPGNPLHVILDAIAQVGWVPYLIVGWVNFTRWRKKLRALQTLELQISQDLGI